jgi:DNA polymerase elongation subunit (family B)
MVNIVYKLVTDVNSLYSHIAIENSFPVGKYNVLLHQDNLKENIKFVNGEFLYKGESMKGDVAHVTLLAPKTLFRPYLGYRINDEYNFLALCKTCVAQKEKSAKQCNHKSPNIRQFSSSYTLIDLQKAVMLGYKILNWYEVHHFENHQPILKDFVQILGVEKLKSSDILSNVPESQQDQICDNVNLKMKLPVQLRISKENCTNNPAQKQLFKDMMNSFFGRFALHTNYSHHYFCRNIHQIEMHASKRQAELVDIFSISDDVCQIEVSAPSKIKPSQKACLYITAEINALARKFIYEKSELIEQANGIVIGIDTDSIIYALPPGVDDVLNYSPAFGDFKRVLGDTSTITSVYSLGPRNYSISYLDVTGCEKHVIKVKGLTTTSINTSDMLTGELYQEFLDKRFNEEFKSIYLPQMRKKLDKQHKMFHDILTHFEFGNEIHAKRYVLQGDNSYITYPYGYTFK